MSLLSDESEFSRKERERERDTLFRLLFRLLPHHKIRIGNGTDGYGRREGRLKRNVYYM